MIYILMMLLLAVSYCDLRNRLISNKLNLIVFLVAAASVARNGDTFWIELGFSYAIIMPPLIVLFSVGIVGGGDVKLIFALLPVMPLHALLNFFLNMALLGAVLAIFVIIYTNRTSSKNDNTVPYGVAISGAFFILAAQGKLLI